MKHLTAGVFHDSEHAGMAVSELKDAGYTEDISVIAKDIATSEVTTHNVKQETDDGVTTGAVTGAVMGGLAGLLVSISTVVLPGVGTLLVAGPLAALWGVTGAATGALAGGMLGALVDAGIPEEQAHIYEEAIARGEVLVIVSSEIDSGTKVVSILNKHGVVETYSKTV